MGRGGGFFLLPFPLALFVPSLSNEKVSRARRRGAGPSGIASPPPPDPRGHTCPWLSVPAPRGDRPGWGSTGRPLPRPRVVCDRPWDRAARVCEAAGVERGCVGTGKRVSAAHAPFAGAFRIIRVNQVVHTIRARPVVGPWPTHAASPLAGPSRQGLAGPLELLSASPFLRRNENPAGSASGTHGRACACVDVRIHACAYVFLPTHPRTAAGVHTRTPRHTPYVVKRRRFHLGAGFPQGSRQPGGSRALLPCPRYWLSPGSCPQNPPSAAGPVRLRREPFGAGPGPAPHLQDPPGKPAEPPANSGRAAAGSVRPLFLFLRLPSPFLPIFVGFHLLPFLFLSFSLPFRFSFSLCFLFLPSFLLARSGAFLSSFLFRFLSFPFLPLFLPFYFFSPFIFLLPFFSLDFFGLLSCRFIFGFSFIPSFHSLFLSSSSFGYFFFIYLSVFLPCLLLSFFFFFVPINLFSSLSPVLCLVSFLLFCLFFSGHIFFLSFCVFFSISFFCLSLFFSSLLSIFSHFYSRSFH